MVNFIKCIQSYGPSFMTKFCSALYLENLLTKIFCAFVLNFKNLHGGVSCMPAALLFINLKQKLPLHDNQNIYMPFNISSMINDIVLFQSYLRYYGTW